MTVKKIINRLATIKYKVITIRQLNNKAPEKSHATEESVDCKSFVGYSWDTLLVAQLVDALRYESEGHGFDSRWCLWNFSLK